MRTLAVLFVALTFAAETAAKDGVHVLVERERLVGDRLEVTFSLSTPHGHPFGAGGLFVVSDGVRFPAGDAGYGRYVAAVAPGRLEFGLEGIRIIAGRTYDADLIFPRHNALTLPFADLSRLALSSR